MSAVGPRLKDLGRWSSGGTPPRDREELWEGELPWISAKDFHNDELREPTTFITEEAGERYSRIAPAGSILVIVRGMALVHGLPVAQTRGRVAFNQDLRGLRPSPKFDCRFVYYALRGTRIQLNAHIDRAAHGTARVNESVMSERLVIPSRDEQTRVARFLDREGARIGAITRDRDHLPAGLLNEFAALLAEYRDALIIEAVTGKLDVSRLSEQQMDESARAAMEDEAPEVLSA